MRIGIMGCGRIAGVMADTINHTEGMVLEAVASRTQMKAEEFKAHYSANKAYGSYEELCEDPDVEVVYIATPMSSHFNDMMLCIQHNKAVLCEKSFTVNEKEAYEVLANAKVKGVLVAEALWTRYMPSRKIISSLISSGRIGNVTSVTANLSYKIFGKERINRADLGGGALLDIGVYPLNFALMVKDGVDIDKMSGNAVTQNGVDVRDILSLTFKDGSIATLFADSEIYSDRKGIIMGTEGIIEVENINNPEEIRIYSSERTPQLLETIKIKEDYNGYEYELYSVEKALRAGKIEVPEMPHSETLRVMRLMDTFRSAWGVKLGSEL